MIEPHQVNYQAPDGASHRWVETLLFPVVVPEEHIYALVYTNVRPGLGVMWNQVIVCGSLTESRSDLLHYNENHFQPAPADLRRVETDIGLRVTSTAPPRDFAIAYDHPDGTSIDVTWKGLMEPFDTHDPAHSPQAGGAADMHADRGDDEFALAGHFDMTGRVEGTLSVRGRTFDVSSVERMDHSWGPRDPMKVPNMFIVSASFGDDLAFHMICPWDPDKPGEEAFTLSHGYVLQDGEVYGLVSNSRITAQHHGLMCMGLQMQVTDIRGRTWNLEASPDIGAPWIAGPNAITHNALMAWRCEGRSGYGVVMKNHSLTYLNSRLGRFYDEPGSTIFV